LVFPPRFETVAAAGFVGLRHDAHEVGRQLDPGRSGRASTNRSDRWTIVERPLGRQRSFGVRRLLGLPRVLGRWSLFLLPRLLGVRRLLGLLRLLGLWRLLGRRRRLRLGRSTERLQRKAEDAREPRSRSSLGDLELTLVDLLSGSQEPRHL
jgi:hypothetical protein